MSMSNRVITLPVAQFARPVSWRELEVAWAVADGLQNKEIAARLDISPCTVAAHMANIRLKTGLPSRAAIAVWADRQTRRAA